MAFTFKFQTVSLILVFCFLSFTPQFYSLSSVSISTTSNSNQTLVCALVPSSNLQSYINCTSFPRGIQIPFPNVSYSRIVGGKGFLCALRSQSLGSSMSVMECWRFLANGNNMSRKRIYRGPVLSELDAGDSHVCGVVNGTNKINCWLWRDIREWESNSVENVSSIAVGGDFVCELDTNGSIICLGTDSNVVGKEPTSEGYSVIAAGSRHACAISLNGSLRCWGNKVGNNQPRGGLMALALGDDRSCAMLVNETVVCWGNDNFRMPVVLQEAKFIGIVAKESVFCGVVASNFSLVCWGNDILDGSQVVFANVMPGSCTSSCPSCGALPGSSNYCGAGLMVCQPCVPIMAPSPRSPDSELAPMQEPSSNGNEWTPRMIAFLVVGCLGSVSLVASITFFLCRYYRGGGGSRVHDSGPMEIVENPQRPQEAAPPTLQKRLSHMYSIGNGGHLEEFPLEVLLKVTDDFSQEYKIGKGSFGSVYHATLEDGREVAIKRAEAIPASGLGTNKRKEEDKEVAFMAELEFLSRLNHKHLVSLLGFYEDTIERVLVYEYMSNFTLHDHLHKLKGSSPLASWQRRLQVALDAARGIDYLHTYAVPPIIHRDIKSSNILLDSNWTAKVSDFGLSLMGPQDEESHLSLWAAGTLGYVDPQYYRLHILTTKSDVYSFGVVLLELLSGYKAIHTNEEGIPRNVVDFVIPYIMRGEIHRVLDPHVPPPSPVEIEAVRFIGYLAVDCVSLEGRNRPSMSEVVSCLERALAACMVHPTLSPSSTVSSR